MLKANIKKEEYDNLPEAIQAEYSEKDGSYTVQVEGMKTQADIDAIKSAKDQAKREQKEAQDALKAAQRENNELSDKVKAYESDENLKLSKEQLVEHERLKRENEALLSDKEELQGKFNGLQGEVTTGKIKSQLAKAAKGKVREDAIGDLVEQLSAKFVFSDGKVLTSPDLGDKGGLEAGAYLDDYTSERSYLAPTNSGGGAGGNKGLGGEKQVGSTDRNQITASSELWGNK